MNISTPNRVRHSYCQQLIGKPAAVMPLLCPVRECDWAVGWELGAVHSHSGLVEPGCVFVTPGQPSAAIWFVTQHNPVSLQVEMVKITPGHSACRLNISLEPHGASGTRATVSYELTSLGETGDNAVSEFTHEAWIAFMQTWENELNHYLETGEKLAA